MALIIRDRVMETSTSTGTGNITLAATVVGFRTFASVCAIGDTFYYMIEAVDASNIPTGDWEAGLGTYSAAGTLTRTTVHASSNAGAAVNFAAGTKYAMVSQTATQVALVADRPVSFFFTTTPTASEVLLLWTPALGETVTFGDEWQFSSGKCLTNPTAAYQMKVYKNGVWMGEITITTAGAVAFSTSAGTLETFVGGTDYMTVEAPATPDTTVANVAITLKGAL